MTHLIALEIQYCGVQDFLQPPQYMGNSQNYGPHLAIDYITAPNIWGYQNGTLHFKYQIPLAFQVDPTDLQFSNIRRIQIHSRVREN